MKIGRRTGDLASGAICLLLGVWYLSEALRDLDFWTPGNQPGGGFFPTLLGSALVLLSCLLLFKGLQIRLDLGEERTIVRRQAVARPLLVLISLAVWVYLFPILGYILSTWLLTGGLMWVFGSASSPRKRALAAVLISALGVIGFYGIFGVLFALQLPAWPSFG